MTTITTDNAVKTIIDERQEEFFDYLRLASVSTQNRNILPTVEYVKQMIKKNRWRDTGLG